MRAAVIMASVAAFLSGCADDAQLAVWHNSTVAKVCSDGAVILEYQGHLYRIVGGFPKRYSDGVTIDRVCAPAT